MTNRFLSSLKLSLLGGSKNVYDKHLFVSLNFVNVKLKIFQLIVLKPTASVNIYVTREQVCRVQRVSLASGPLGG